MIDVIKIIYKNFSSYSSLLPQEHHNMYETHVCMYVYLMYETFCSKITQYKPYYRNA